MARSAGDDDVTCANPGEPYLAISLSLSREALADLIAEAPAVTPERGKCYAFGPVADGLAEACDRLLALQDRPEDLPVLGPMIRREMLYRLPRGPQAAGAVPDRRLGPAAGAGARRLLEGTAAEA